MESSVVLGESISLSEGHSTSLQNQHPFMEDPFLDDPFFYEGGVISNEILSTEPFLYEGGAIPNEIKGSITRVRIDPQVAEIAQDAFALCISLTEVRFKEGLKVIGQGAFSCTALQSVSLPLAITASWVRAHSLAAATLSSYS